MLKDEDHHVSKNFQSDLSDIPVVQISSMNKDASQVHLLGKTKKSGGE